MGFSSYVLRFLDKCGGRFGSAYADAMRGVPVLELPSAIAYSRGSEMTSSTKFKILLALLSIVGWFFRENIFYLLMEGRLPAWVDAFLLTRYAAMALELCVQLWPFTVMLFTVYTFYRVKLRHHETIGRLADLSYGMQNLLDSADNAPVKLSRLVKRYCEHSVRVFEAGMPAAGIGCAYRTLDASGYDGQ